MRCDRKSPPKNKSLSSSKKYDKRKIFGLFRDLHYERKISVGGENFKKEI